MSTANWADVMDEDLSPVNDVAARLLETAAVVGCLPYAATPAAASSPPRGQRALALFHPDSRLLAAAARTSSAVGQVSQRAARRPARAVSSDLLRDVQLRADARTGAGLASTEAPASLRALRHGVNPQEVVETVRRELLIAETDGLSPKQGHGSHESALPPPKEQVSVVNGAATELAEVQKALERETREKAEALAARDIAERELEAAQADAVHRREEALIASKATAAAKHEVEQLKARANNDPTHLEQELRRLGSELTGWRNRSQSCEAKLVSCEVEGQRLVQANKTLSASVGKLETDLKSTKAQVSTLNGMRVAGHKDLLAMKQQIASLKYDLTTERARAHDQMRSAETREVELRAQVALAHKATDRLASLLDGTGDGEDYQWEQLRRKRDAMEDRQLADEMQYAISCRDRKLAEDALSRSHELSVVAQKNEQREKTLGLGAITAAALSISISILSAGGSPAGLLVWIAVSLDIAAILFCSLSRDMALCCRLDRITPRMQRMLGITLLAVITLLLCIDIIPLVMAASYGDTMATWAAPGLATLRVALVSVLAATGVVSTMQRFTGCRSDGRSGRNTASRVHAHQGDDCVACTEVARAALFPAWETGAAGGGAWAPKVAVHPSSLELAGLWSRSVHTHIRVYNGGNATLRVALESDKPWIHIPPNSNAPNLSVAPQTWKDLPIRVGPVVGSGAWKTTVRVFTDDPSRTEEGPMEVPVQLITSAPKLRLQSDAIRIDMAPLDKTCSVRLGSDAAASVTGATLLFNDGNDVLQLSQLLSNSQAARVGVARASEPERNLPLPVFLHPGQPPFVLTVAIPANEAVSVSATPPHGLQVVICSSDPRSNGKMVVPCRVLTLQHKIQAMQTIAKCFRRWHTPHAGPEPEPEPEPKPEPPHDGPDQIRATQRNFVMAAVRGDSQTLHRLLQLDVVDANAAATFDKDLQSALIGSTADMDLNIPSSSTALSAAVANGHQDCVAFLLERGVDVNAADANGDTALIMAARLGCHDAMRLLLFPPFGNGADVAQCNDEGSTAFHAACCRGDPVCVQLLLDSGCDFTRIDRKGRSGRAIAVENGHFEIANTLREWSANNLKDSSGRTARERAVERRGDAWGKLSRAEQLLAVRREEASMAAELAEAESAFFEAAAAHRSG